MTVRLSGPLRDFVAANVGADGEFENVSEYVRDLIRRDKARAEQAALDRLKAEHQHARQYNRQDPFHLVLLLPQNRFRKQPAVLLNIS